MTDSTVEAEQHSRRRGDRAQTDAHDTAATSSLFGRTGLGTRGRRGLAIVVLLAIAALVRVVPLYWSPHPATLDGFFYAGSAVDTLATGSYPLDRFRVDSFGFTTVIAVLSAVVEKPPLRITQPLSSLIGVGAVVTGLAVVRRLATEFAWSRRRVASAVVATGVVLVFDGIFLRRTMVADEEVMAYVLIPLAVLALHRWLVAARTRRRWGVLAGVLLLVLPITHVLSTLVAALSILALVVAHAIRNPNRRTVLGGGVIAAGFWLYLGTYYHLAASTVVDVPYVDRVVAFPGLFLAWVIILVVGTAWVWTTSSRARIAAVVGPVLVFYAVTVVNAVISVYPGTPQTPLVVLVPVLLLLVPILLGGVGMTTISLHRPTGAVVLALLAGPIAIVGFSLTASLTPEYVNTAIRTQTFGHLPVALLVGLVIAGLLARGPTLGVSSGSVESMRRTGSGPGVVRVLLVVLVLVATVGSLPFAYLTLDTGTYPSTTLDSEFQGVEFVATETDGPWATDHSMTQVGVNYFQSDVSPSATASWLSGGASPTCPVLSQESWTTTGAHLFPFAPETVSPATYDGWLRSRHVVYANTGRDPVTVSVPTAATGQGC